MTDELEHYCEENGCHSGNLDDHCEECQGTGMRFEGDVHVGDCYSCGGNGYID